MSDKFRWPLATVVGIEGNMLLVEFLDAKEELCSISVNVKDGKKFSLGETVDLSRDKAEPVEDNVERKPVRVDRVSIKPEKLYSLKIDGKKLKGLFQERDSMSGMKKLVRVGNGPYCEVVVDCPDGVMEVLSTVMGSNEDIDVTVVKASPDLVDEMMEKLKEGDKE